MKKEYVSMNKDRKQRAYSLEEQVLNSPHLFQGGVYLMLTLMMK